VSGCSAAPVIGLAAIALLLSSGCGPKRIATPAPPRVQVVLLPEPENAPPSAATVTARAGAVALTAPFESTTVAANRPPSAPVTLAEAEVQRQFGRVLGDLPEAPQHFSLYFRTESLELADESRAMLQDVLRAAAARKVPEVTVIGHTDTTGTARNNFQLGLERARTVKDMLLKAGLDPALIEVESHGEADQLRKTPDNTPEPRNRRVEITIR
jgi:peptidoglycan-associated lipoprotein